MSFKKIFMNKKKQQMVPNKEKKYEEDIKKICMKR